MIKCFGILIFLCQQLKCNITVCKEDPFNDCCCCRLAVQPLQAKQLFRADKVYKGDNHFNNSKLSI